MKDKHIKIRINQCLENAKASNCPRRKFGALIVDPERNVVLADGYNGGLRKGGPICSNINGVAFCARNGLTEEDFSIAYETEGEIGSDGEINRFDAVIAVLNGEVISRAKYTDCRQKIQMEARMKIFIQELIEKYPKIPSGEKVEIGCVHAEANTIINACNSGNSVKGAWLFINGEPCINCAKLIINSGIERVYVVDKGYHGTNGCQLMEEHGVEIIPVEGPQDPRI